MSFNYGQRPRNGGRSSEHPRGGNGSIGRPEAGFDEVVRTGGGKGPGRTRGGFRREEGYQRGGGDPRRSSPLHGQHPLPEEGRGGPRTMDPPLVETGGEKSIPTGNECVVCCREISVYAVGPCDHTVCYICSTRLRALCKTQECPVCRANVEEVYFVKNNTPFTKLKEKTFGSKQEEFAIFFEDDEVRLKYEELLQHRCKECERRALIASRSGERPPALEIHATFADLAEHVLQEHRRHFCALCVEHLNLFTFERQAYSKNDLRRHMTEGDLDDKSHKGHPHCDFCRAHFLDKDELYRHLKVEHFSCFICGAVNTVSRVFPYYATYDDLRQHFKRNHFLCEEGECAVTRFVAFPSEFEYKAHWASAHSDHLSREEQRAVRSVKLDFGTLPHDRELYSADGRSGGGGGGRRGFREGGGSRRDRDYRDERRRRDVSPPAEPVALNRTAAVDEWGREIVFMDMTSTTDFPSLEGAPANISRPLVPTPQYGRKMTMLRTAEEFPSLGPPPNAGPPLAMNVRRTAPSFKRVINNSNDSLSLSSVVATSLATRHPNPPAHSAPSSVQKISGSSSGSSSSSRLSERVVVSGGCGGVCRSELFPSLPEPVSDSNFGNILKPLAPKKANSGRHQARHTGSGSADCGGSGSAGSGWAAVAAGSGMIVHKKLNTCGNSDSNKKNKKKAEDATPSASVELNGDSNQSTNIQQRLVNLRTILPSLSEIENNNRRKDPKSNRRNGSTQEVLQDMKGALQDSNDFDLNLCNATWGARAKKKDLSNYVERKAPKPPTVPRGLRKDEEFPSLEPAQCKDEVATGIRPLKPKYKGVKPGDVVADMKKSEGAFIQPPYYSKRNTEFMGMLKLLLDGSTEQVFEYRTLFGNLRNGLISAEKFVQQCLQLFPDPTEFIKIFPDLVCLLPDIDKQNELVPIYDELRIRFGGTCSGGKGGSKSGGNRGDKSAERPWVRCTECGQITTPEDVQPHLRAH